MGFGRSCCIVVASLALCLLSGCSSNDYRWNYTFHGRATNLLGCGNNVHSDSFAGRTSIARIKSTPQEIVIAVDDESDCTVLLLVMKSDAAQKYSPPTVSTIDGTLQAFLVRFDRGKLPRYMSLAQGQSIIQDALIDSRKSAVIESVFPMEGTARITNWTIHSDIEELEVDLATVSPIPVFRTHLRHDPNLYDTSGKALEASGFLDAHPSDKASIKGTVHGAWVWDSPLL
jgi:hypothetical protein